MKRVMLATLLAIVATQTSATAMEITCFAPIIGVGTQSKDRADTVVGVDVFHTEEDGWEVRHRMGNGSEIRRSTQYDMHDTSDRKMTQWRGTLLKRASMEMVGEIRRENNTGRLIYMEWIYDRGRLTMNSYAYCRDMQQAARNGSTSPVPSQREPEPAPATDWPKWLKP